MGLPPPPPPPFTGPFNAPLPVGIPVAEPATRWAIADPAGLRATDIVVEGIRLGRRRWVPIVTCWLLLAGGAPLLLAALGQGTTLGEVLHWFVTRRFPGQETRTGIATSLETLELWIFSPILSLVLPRLALGGLLDGSDLGIGGALRWGLVRWPRALWLQFATFLAAIPAVIAAFVVVSIGFSASRALGIACTVLGVIGISWLIVRWILAPSVLAFDDIRGFKALRRSWDLTGGRFGRIAGVLALGALLGFGAAILAAALQTLVPANDRVADLLRAAIQIAVVAPLVPFGAGVTAVLFAHLHAVDPPGMTADAIHATLEAGNRV